MRKRYSMDKQWRFHRGDIPMPPALIHEEAYARSKAGGAAGAGGISCDDVAWPVVDLPHDYAVSSDFDEKVGLSQGYKPRGKAWYRKSFYISKEHRNKQLLLVFDGAATACEVYFNGSVLKRNFSGYNEFTVDISDRAFFGDRPNVLAVRVDAQAFEGWWYEGAGIYRHVWLDVKESLHIAHNGLWIKPVKKDGNRWEIALETIVENSSYQPAEFELEAQVLKDGVVVSKGHIASSVSAAEKSAVKQTMSVEEPQLWDVDSPELYELRCRILQNGAVIDETAENFGFRTIAFTPEKGFFLNGRNLKIKGVCCHPDHAGVGAAVPDSIQEYRIQKLKEIGCNAYRCSHGMPAREILNACDRLGILVMDENRHYESSEECLEQVRNMVTRDRNHPCVFMYSLYNEEPLQGTPEGRKVLARMQAELKRLDDTRPTLGGMNGGVMEESGSASLMDVVGINYNIGIYDRFHEKYPQLCAIGSENVSALSVRGCYQTDDGKHVKSCYDEELVPWGRSVRETWRTVSERDFIAGEFVWTGFDYRGEPTPYRWPTVSSLFGLFDTCGFAKDAAYFAKACWDSKPMIHILPHWNWKDGETVRVMTVTNCDEVELFVNGRSLGRKSSDVYEQNEWQVPFEAGVLSAVGYQNGAPAAKAEQKTAGAPKRLVLQPSRSWVNNDGMDAVTLNICAVDENGIAVPMAEHSVTVSCTGGKVLGMGNGDPNSHEADCSSQRSLFAGWCQAVLAPDTDTQTFAAVAVADGLEPAEFCFEVRSNPNQYEYIYPVTDIPVTGWRMSGFNYAEKPDPTLTLSDNDMNSFEPISFGEEFQSTFTEGYRLYLTRMTIPSDRDYQLVFKIISGYEAEFYINDEQIYKGGFGGGQRGISLPLKGISGEVRLAVCIKASTYTGTSGIKGTVCLRAE